MYIIYVYRIILEYVILNVLDTILKLLYAICQRVQVPPGFQPTTLPDARFAVALKLAVSPI